MTRKRHKLPLRLGDWPRIRDTKVVGSKGRFVVDLWPHVYGTGSRLYFETFDAAAIKAKPLATEHRNQGAEFLDFPTELRVEAAACHAMLKPLGVSLKTAIEHYIKWSRDEKHRNDSRLVRDCLADYVAARTVHFNCGELSEITIREIRIRMKQFELVWSNQPIRSITRRTVLDYLREPASCRNAARLAD